MGEKVTQTQTLTLTLTLTGHFSPQKLKISKEALHLSDRLTQSSCENVQKQKKKWPHRDLNMQPFGKK